LSPSLVGLTDQPRPRAHTATTKNPTKAAELNAAAFAALEELGAGDQRSRVALDPLRDALGAGRAMCTTSSA
jgi:hypothetical protein